MYSILICVYNRKYIEDTSLTQPNLWENSQLLKKFMGILPHTLNK